MEKQEMLTPIAIGSIVCENIKNLENIVGYTYPYLRNENSREVYEAPLLVRADDRTIDMVGIAEITIDAYSGKVLKTYTEEEIDSIVKDLLSRKADG